MNNIAWFFRQKCCVWIKIFWYFWKNCRNFEFLAKNCWVLSFLSLSFSFFNLEFFSECPKKEPALYLCVSFKSGSLYFGLPLADLKLTLRLRGIVRTVLIIPFSWQCQNLCLLSLAPIIPILESCERHLCSNGINFFLMRPTKNKKQRIKHH